jgi:hypothetical protein
MKRPRGCRNGGVGGVRNRQSSTVSDKNGGEGAGAVKVTSAGGHVVGGACQGTTPRCLVAAAQHRRSSASCTAPGCPRQCRSPADAPVADDRPSWLVGVGREAVG